jgi:NAD(P)-dependent dehydrogenase (short-subunit alcohol dehydrogenase family)
MSEQRTVADFGLAGRVAIVTGGSRGIGLAIARGFARAGAAVVVASRKADACAAAAKEIEAAGGQALAVAAHLGEPADLRSLVDRTVGHFGGIDILVNNAGVGAIGTVADNPDEEWHRVFDVNVVGMVRTARAALPFLRRSQHAAIVNTCSVAAIAGLPQRALYSATKGAVYSLTLAMAADHLADGIRVNCVSPGTADTPWIGRLLDQADDPAAERAALQARQPMGRLVSAGEVAAAIAYLASPAASAVTGTALAVDGGMSGLRLRPRQ